MGLKLSFKGGSEDTPTFQHPLFSLSSAGNYWWWVPIVAPMVGAATGTVTYQLCVEFHHPPAPDEEIPTAAPEKLQPGAEKEVEIPVYAVNKYAETWAEGSLDHAKWEAANST